MADLKKQFLGSTRYYGIRCASYKVVFVKRKRLLKTQFLKIKGCFSGEKVISANFSCIIEQARRQGTIYKGLQCIVTVIGQVIRSFL